MVLAGKLAAHVLPAAGIELERACFLTDLMNVLWWINQGGLLSAFVANRVQCILDATNTAQWSYVPSAFNPADVASRGVSLERLLVHPLWWNGPAFVRGEAPWPEQPIVKPSGAALQEKRELKVAKFFNCLEQQPDGEFFSTLRGATAFVGWALRWKRPGHGPALRLELSGFRAGSRPRWFGPPEEWSVSLGEVFTPLLPEERAHDRRRIIYLAQRVHFHGELAVLEKGIPVAGYKPLGNCCIGWTRAGCSEQRRGFGLPPTSPLRSVARSSSRAALR